MMNGYMVHPSIALTNLSSTSNQTLINNKSCVTIYATDHKGMLALEQSV